VGKGSVYIFWWANLRDRDHMEDTGIDGMIILKCTSKPWHVGTWTVWIWLRMG